MLTREYAGSDAAATLDLFTRAITTTGRARYTAEQVAAWLGSPRDPAQWNADRLRVYTAVAEIDGQVGGFTDLGDDGYVDRLFVHPALGRRGVGQALLQHVRTVAADRGLVELTTHASLVARPVFERAGFHAVHDDVVRRDDVELLRFFMRAPVAKT
ncbi:GNAT family N-acetyltransferase [Cellulomonas aerilata]|uniref:Acetyltransferase n=1 Tax=Cellulomonas aerilata TaxID=515326 RepID=A0A512DBW3_9CELL|nr:GNAT family N-acetyltransferase [Cellulomonas aerilata]GEO33971.1 acetyltransferase [Cellulomonas aerilata]